MKFLKDLRLRLEFVVLWLAVVVARAIPVQTSSWLSGKLWRLIAPRLSRQKRALANIELAFPEKSPAERKAIAAAMWENLGRTFAESLHIKALTKSDRIVFEPSECFDEAASGAKPFIVCGLHLGNWEILAHGGQRLGVSLIGVYQRMSNPHVEALMHSVRKPLYKAGLTPKTPMAARPLARHQGRRLSVLPCRPQRRQRTVCALLRKARAVNSLPSASRPHDRYPALCRRRIPPSGLAFQHPHRPHYNAADEQQRGRCSPRDAGTAAPIRGFHPRSARTMDVGAPEVGLIALASSRTGEAWPRPTVRLRLSTPVL